MTQEAQVLKYIKDFGSITPVEAVADLGIYRLAARVNELRNKGFDIKTTIEKGKNRWGDDIKYARYTM